jgi:hypothetical protein
MKRFWTIEAKNFSELWKHEAQILLDCGAKLEIPVNAMKFANSQREIFENYFPEIFHKAKAYAEVFNLNEKGIENLFLTENISESHKTTDPGCAVIMIKKGEDVFIGRNFDGKLSAEEFSTCVEYELSGFKYWTNSDMNSHSTPMRKEHFRLRPQEGWTKDVYVAINSGPSQKKPSGISATQIIEKLMIMSTQGVGVNKLIEYVVRVPTNRGMSISIAAKDGLTIIEKDINKSKVRHSNEVLYATNHFIDNEMKINNGLLFKKIPFHASFPRYGYIESRLEEIINGDSMGVLKEALNTPPLSQNFRDNRFDCVTGWTSVIQLGKKSQTIFSPNNPDFKEELVLEYV